MPWRRPRLVDPRIGSHRADNALQVMELRRRRRLLAVGLTSLVALADIVGALLPRTRGGLAVLERNLPLGLTEGGRALLLVAGILLLLLARGLARGYRRAWLGVLVLTAGSALLHLAASRDPVAAALAIAPPAYLWAIRDTFVARARPLRARGLLVVPLLAAAIVGFGLLGWWQLRTAFPPTDLTGRIQSIVRATLFLDPGVTPTTEVARAFLRSFQVLGASLAVVTVAAALEPLVERDNHAADARARSRFLARWGRTGMAGLAGLPENDGLTLCDGRAVLGLRVVSGVAIGIGDPVGEPGTEAQALEDLVVGCESRGQTPVLLAASPATAARAEAFGFASVRIGEDAIVDLPGFTTVGKGRAKVRQNVHRAEREGIRATPYTASVRTPELDAQLRAISAEWLRAKHGPELGFTLGRLDLSRLDHQEMWIARREPSGHVEAFVSWLPYRDGAAVVLDLLRRRRDCPVGTMELLILRGLEAFRDAGRVEASLGAVPLATVPRDDGPDEGRLGEALRWLYEHGGRVYEARGLFRFKAKFDPRWEPMHLCYPESANLARVVTTIGFAFLPTGPAAWWRRRRDPSLGPTVSGHDA